MRKTLCVFKHELFITLTDKWYVLVLFLGPFLSLLFGYISYGLMKNDPSVKAVTQIIQPKTISTSSVFQQGYVDQIDLIKALPEGCEGLHAYEDGKSAMTALRAGEISGLFLITDTFYENQTIYVVRKDFNPVGGYIEGTDFLDAVDFNLRGADQTLWHLKEDPLKNQEIVAIPSTSSSPLFGITDLLGLAIPYTVTFFFLLTMMGSVSMLTSSLAAENKSRMLEMLLVSLNPVEILTGKIMALGIAGLVQTAAWVGSGWLLTRSDTLPSTIAQEIHFTPVFVFWGFLFFVLGYFLYATIMAGLGSVIGDTYESTYFGTMMSLPVMGIVIIIISLMNTPDHWLMIFFSLFPLSAPFTILSRMLLNDVPLWQLVMAALLQVGAIILCIRWVSGIFRAQTLLSGNQKFSWKTLWKALSLKP